MKNLLSVCMFGGCTKGKGDQGMLQIPRSKEKMSDTKPIYLFPSPPQHTHTHTHISLDIPTKPNMPAAKTASSYLQTLQDMPEILGEGNRET